MKPATAPSALKVQAALGERFTVLEFDPLFQHRQRRAYAVVLPNWSCYRFSTPSHVSSGRVPAVLQERPGWLHGFWGVNRFARSWARDVERSVGCYRRFGDCTGRP